MHSHGVRTGATRGLATARHLRGSPLMHKTLVSEDRIVDAILTVRGQRVVIASDLAVLYGVPTDRLNEQVKRNRKRFPADFCFRLTRGEQTEVSAICGHLTRLKFAPIPPLAFTEYGAIMAANVLNSPRAVDVSVQVVRAFMSLRNAVASHRDLAKKIEALEKRYDGQFKTVFDALRELLRDVPKRPMGFR